MTKAIWNDAVLAESDATVQLEGNQYFPPESLNEEFFQTSQKTSYCGSKGDCNYYDVVVDGRTNENAAWVYRDPKPAAENIRGYVAFWNGVEIQS